MAFKEVSDLNADVTISLGGTNRKTGKKNPTEVEGYYLGRREVTDTKKKTGKSWIYFFQTPKGNLGVWGKTDIDRKMDSAVVGNMVKIAFDRMVATPNGEMYKYKVFQDDTNTIEVTASQGRSASTEDDEDLTQGYATADDEEEDSYTAYAPTANMAKVAAGATLSAADRKAKVQELLKKKS